MDKLIFIEGMIFLHSCFNLSSLMSLTVRFYLYTYIHRAPDRIRTHRIFWPDRNDRIVLKTFVYNLNFRKFI